MIDTILFDLDGTLLPMDLTRFMEIYFHEMGRAFEDTIDPQLLKKYVWTATEAMIANPGEQTNETVFMERFGQLVGREMLSFYQQRFTEFYNYGFLKAKASIFEVASIKNSVMLLQQKGYDLIIATNPLFPEIAIHHRIRWAGFEPDIFSYITAYERNHYCKPHVQFYQELLTQTGKKPEQCLMVGNDVQEDLAARALGVSTYLVTNHLIHRSETDIDTTHQGSYDDFAAFVRQLPAISKR